MPDWRLRAQKQRKMQQVDEIELKCTQLIEQFASNDTVLNMTAEKCEAVVVKLADLLDPASKTCMLPFLKDADGIFTQEGSQTEILSVDVCFRVICFLFLGLSVYHIRVLLVSWIFTP